MLKDWETCSHEPLIVRPLSAHGMRGTVLMESRWRARQRWESSHV